MLIQVAWSKILRTTLRACSFFEISVPPAWTCMPATLASLVNELKQHITVTS